MAALAYEGAIAATSTKSNLVAAMRIMQRTGFPKSKMVGSWAGAVGHAQFMPEAYLQYAVDGDGDGVVDLWDLVEDAFASKANYLRERNAKTPWRRNEAWIAEVQPPAASPSRTAISPSKADRQLDDPRRNADRRRRSPICRGVSTDTPPPCSRRRDARADRDDAAELRPFRRLQSFAVYALAIALWSNAIAGRPGLETPWPVDEPGITCAQAYALQKAERRSGHTDAEPDGDINVRARRSARSSWRTGWWRTVFPRARC